MTDDLQKRIQDALANPQNMGELANADAVGTVGNSDCGEMLRMWIKFKEEKGKKVIDRATFQSFGCETAIAVASLATELIRGKTPEEALANALFDDAHSSAISYYLDGIVFHRSACRAQPPSCHFYFDRH